MQSSLRACIQKGFVQSAHDVSEGGIFVSLTESAMCSGIGYQIEIPFEFRNDIFLFGESQGRVIITCKPSNKTELIAFLIRLGLKTDLLVPVLEKISKLINRTMEPFNPIKICTTPF